MATQTTTAQPPRFVLFPFLAQGHMIPMIDIARLLAARGVLVTIITTPLNARRFDSMISRAIQFGLQIQVIEVPLPCAEAGLPEGCENLDMLPNLTEFGIKLFMATLMLKPKVEEILRQLEPSPSCLISDMCYPWSTQVAVELDIPRIVFHGMGCFAHLCIHILRSSDIDLLASDGEWVSLPGVPGNERIEFTKAQLPGTSAKQMTKEWLEFRKQVKEADKEAYGVVVNTFEELEAPYIQEYRKLKVGKKNVWCIGPVSLSNMEKLDKAERGNKPAIAEIQRLVNWLDSREPKSVLYACLGSVARLGTSQLKQLGLGLESSNRPFIWVVKNPSEQFNVWLKEDNFEDRIKPRGLLIHGWSPQVLILSHPSVGGFLTHCGWNSTLEGISSGLPMITWPVLGEQFMNEKFVVDILGAGIRVGVEVPVLIGEEEEMGVLVDKDDVKAAVEKLMDEEGQEGEIRRKRAEQLGDMAFKAVQEGGSSHLSITRLIHDIIQLKNVENDTA